MSHYVGRFAPSPTGLLHAGSLVAALASWLDARAHAGRWLVRIEDLDSARNVAGADLGILDQLARCGLLPDEPPVRQSARVPLYERALERLVATHSAYPCGCSRGDIAAATHGGRLYPGTCRDGLHGRPARSMRLRTDSFEPIVWRDRRLGPQVQDVEAAVGDFVLKRADAVWAYQLAVVVDDAAQGVTDIVRGADLADNTARQILLQRLLGLPTPNYLHTPLVLGTDGRKLSKQNEAAPLDLAKPLAALRAAGAVLGVTADGTSVASWLAQASERWREAAR